MAFLEPVLKVGASASALTVGALYFLQRSLLFPAPRVAEPVSTYGGRHARHVTQIGAAWFPPKTKESTVIVYFHGNADQIGWSGAFLGKHFHAKGLGFLAVEFPGYGFAEGDPTEASIFRAADDALRYAKTELEVDASRLVLLGQSLGCAPALHVATVSHRDVPKLALLAPFESVSAMAATLLPFVPEALLRPLVKDKFDNRRATADLPSTTSTLVLHGTQDDIVPFTHGANLADRLNAVPRDPHSSPKIPRSFVPIEGAGHNDLFSPPFDALVLDALLAFALQQGDDDEPH
mmetsp:Transcript_13481/g.43908  ORF Transcript_13481/g.43908 Transcript_13481/m.43908 type:complete len:292 (+) Transcript_13481:56-931(+)